MDDLFRIAVSNAAWAAGLALVAAAGSRLFRRRPALAHTLWLLVLLKLVTPSVLNVAPPWGKVPVMDARAGDLAIHVVVPAVEITSSRSSDAGSPEKRVLAPSPLHAASTPTAGTWPWRILIALGWLAGAVIWWACVVLSIRRFRKLLRVCIAAPEALQERVKQIAARIGLGARRLPRVMIIPARIPPFVWASLTGRPRLLLPHELWGRLDESQQNALLAHELAHLKRGDHWVRWLEAIVLGLYWWDPIAWLARRELERTEEESCDAWVVWSQPSAAGSYAEALVATAAFLSEVHRPLPIGGSGFRSTSAIKRRLEMLLSDAAKPSIGRARSMKLLVLAALCLPLLPVPAGENRSVRAGEPTEQSQGTKAQAAGQRAVVPGTVVGAPIVGGQFVVIRPVVRHVGGQLELEPSPLQPARRVELNSPMSGTLQKALCKPGQQVKKGDVLFQFDARSAELELQKAEAEVMRMQARLTGFDLQPGSRRSGEGHRPPDRLSCRPPDPHTPARHMNAFCYDVSVRGSGTTMHWYNYLAYFFGGAFLANAVPHFGNGVSGHPFQSPFSKPPGQGLSSSIVNVLWGFFNLIVAYLLILRVGSFSVRNLGQMGAAGAGALFMSLQLAWAFGRFHGGLLKK